MSDQRYALEHTALKGAGETRGGLSLLVRDEWSGEARDPVTLSGGETFVVSLALALGLTDVVTQEAAATNRAPTSAPCSSTRASVPWMPTPSTT